MPAISRSSVVLPEPLRPTKPTDSPGSISNETSRSAQISSVRRSPRRTIASFSVRLPLRVDAEAAADVLEPRLSGLMHRSSVLKRPRGPAPPARGRTRDRRSATRSARARGRARAARSRASTSMSQRISRWSETNPTGQTSTALDARRAEVVELLEDVGPEPRLAGRARALEGERPATRGRPAPRPAATSRAAGRGTGRPSARIRAGQAVRREDDMRVGRRARGRRARRGSGSCACQLSTNRAPARPASASSSRSR